MELIKAKKRALSRARAYARQGNCAWTQHFINQAENFFPVTKYEIAAIQRVLNRAKKLEGAKCKVVK